MNAENWAQLVSIYMLEVRQRMETRDAGHAAHPYFEVRQPGWQRVAS